MAYVCVYVYLGAHDPLVPCTREDSVGVRVGVGVGGVKDKTTWRKPVWEKSKAVVETDGANRKRLHKIQGKEEEEEA
jgi:hypothetical protein